LLEYGRDGWVDMLGVQMKTALVRMLVRTRHTCGNNKINIWRITFEYVKPVEWAQCKVL
jgi:hypothetical protein